MKAYRLLTAVGLLALMLAGCTPPQDSGATLTVSVLDTDNTDYPKASMQWFDWQTFRFGFYQTTSATYPWRHSFSNVPESDGVLVTAGIGDDSSALFAGELVSTKGGASVDLALYRQNTDTDVTLTINGPDGAVLSELTLYWGDTNNLWWDEGKHLLGPITFPYVVTLPGVREVASLGIEADGLSNGASLSGLLTEDASAGSVEATVTMDWTGPDLYNWASPSTLAGGLTENTAVKMNTAAKWYKGTVGDTEERWYKFSTVPGRVYAVGLSDMYSGFDSYTADIVLDAVDDGENPVFSDLDYGYAIFPTEANTIYVRVTPYPDSGGGTFALGFEDLTAAAASRSLGTTGEWFHHPPHTGAQLRR